MIHSRCGGSETVDLLGRYYLLDEREDRRTRSSPPNLVSSLITLERLTDPERLAQVGEWIIECETDGDLLDRVQDATS